MIVPDTSSYDYRFMRTLNEDVKLVSDEYGKYDLDMDNGDYVNVTGLNSLQNACIIAILTRFRELKNIPTYANFGCRVHDQIKDNQNKMTEYKIETAIFDTLNRMRRIRVVNSVKISKMTDGYDIEFSVTSINDETVGGRLSL